jgi:xylulokinase
VILTIDLGTSVTKVSLWDERGLVALGASPVSTSRPAPGWSEQDPNEWWASVVDASAQVRARAPQGMGSVEVVGCTGARQTFALFDGAGAPLGQGLVWSDRRAGVEAAMLAGALGIEDEAPNRSGMMIDAGSVAAKVAWLAIHDRQRLDASAWLLAPRDLVAWRLTGTVATDPTMASRTGLYDADGRVVGDLAGLAGPRLPPVMPSDRVTGEVGGPEGAALGLRAGTPVVIGAGDRPCEVLGAGATESRPMVSWGTTANVSVPVGSQVAPPNGIVLSGAVDGGWLLEGGLSGAGSFVAWLGRLTGHAPEDLAALALQSPPGAGGVLAEPWLEGARAPWWQPDAGAAFIGLASVHGLPDVARAAFESVAWEVARCLEAIASRQPEGAPVAELALAGSGAGTPVWVEALTGITGLPANSRRSGQAASAGAALLAATAMGLEYDLDVIDPVVQRTEPDGPVTARYAELRDAARRTAETVVGLARPPRAVPAASTRPGGHECE